MPGESQPWLKAVFRGSRGRSSGFQSLLCALEDRVAELQMDRLRQLPCDHWLWEGGCKGYGLDVIWSPKGSSTQTIIPSVVSSGK
jgi:hypothetical protein